VVIPKRLRGQLLEELHEGHLGVCRMKALARSFVWWPGLDQEIENMVAGCDQCKMTSSLPSAAPRHPWQHLTTHWERVHIDFGECDKKHFLVVVDAFSKWPEVRYMSSTTTERTIEVLDEIFAIHGFPQVLASDNGPQLTASEFESFLEGNRISHHKSPPYHPATNGLAESMVKSVKQ
jgi:transposase InsO family protein